MEKLEFRGDIHISIVFQEVIIDSSLLDSRILLEWTTQRASPWLSKKPKSGIKKAASRYVGRT